MNPAIGFGKSAFERARPSTMQGETICALIRA